MRRSRKYFTLLPSAPSQPGRRRTSCAGTGSAPVPLSVRSGARTREGRRCHRRTGLWKPSIPTVRAPRGSTTTGWAARRMSPPIAGSGANRDHDSAGVLLGAHRPRVPWPRCAAPYRRRSSTVPRPGFRHPDIGACARGRASRSAVRPPSGCSPRPFLVLVEANMWLSRSARQPPLRLQWCRDGSRRPRKRAEHWLGLRAGC